MSATDEFPGPAAPLIHPTGVYMDPQWVEYEEAHRAEMAASPKEKRDALRAQLMTSIERLDRQDALEAEAQQ
jgi:hypothetical protein